MSDPVQTPAGLRGRDDLHTAFLLPEAVLLDETTGDVHRLNGGAAAVWMLLDGQSSPTDIANELSEVFGLQADTVGVQVDAALAEFRESGLLECDKPEDRLHEPNELPQLARPPDH